MDIKAIVSQMTLEEKAGLCSGLDFWHTKPVERLGVPAVMVSDGPHGLRKQDLQADHLGMNESIKAVCMPAACATAASFDRELIGQMGRAIGSSCQHEELSVVLGPAVNIKRSPLCGRNFEYFSEDPYLAGEMSAAYIAGVQSQNVGTSIKHFAANNQEHRRMSSSSNIDERTLREIYLPAFEISVKKSQPWTVMCSYNRLNGTYASEHPWLLTEVLRDEWGFEGYVMSDWGAVSNRVAGLAAGLDLEMPASGGINEDICFESENCRFSADGKADTVWTIIRETGCRLTIHLVNLKGNDERWNVAKREPEPAEKIRIHLRLDRPVDGFYCASADRDSLGAEKLPYAFRNTDQGRIYSVDVPAVQYWTAIWASLEE